jgi:hypothetical protein
LEGQDNDCCSAIASHDAKDIIASGGMYKDPTVKISVPNLKEIMA